MIAWTFEISQPANTRKGYVGDYGCWSAPAATEDAARKRVNAEVAQPYDDVRLVAGDLLTVSVDDRILWDNRGRRGEPILSPRQRSQAALRAIQRWRAGL